MSAMTMGEELVASVGRDLLGYYIKQGAVIQAANIWDVAGVLGRVRYILTEVLSGKVDASFRIGFGTRPRPNRSSEMARVDWLQFSLIKRLK